MKYPAYILLSIIVMLSSNESSPLNPTIFFNDPFTWPPNICSDNYGCVILNNNLLDHLPNIATEIDCLYHCRTLPHCLFYTWYSGLNDCFLFSTCDKIDSSCSGCHTGPSHCPTSTQSPSPSSPPSCVPPSSPVTGSWFCPPSSRSHLTCHLECEPGFAPSIGMTRTSCVEGSWSIPPSDMSCSPAVAIVTGGEPSESSVEVFAPGVHHLLAPLPDLRVGHSIDLVDGRIILCGDWYIGMSCLEMASSSSWIKHSSLRFRRDVHTSVVMSSQLYLLGGASSPDTTEKLDPSQGSDWISSFNLEEETYRACAVKSSPEVFLTIGGWIHPSSVIAYNVTSRTATRMKNLLQPRSCHGCSLMRNSTSGFDFIVVGGGYNAGDLRSSEIYHMETGEWTKAGDMAEARQGVSLVALEDKVYALGGYGHTNVEVFDWRTASWSMEDDLLQERSYQAVTTVPRVMLDSITSS